MVTRDGRKGLDIWAVHHVQPQPVPGPRLSEQDLLDGVSWPYPPEWIVRFGPERHGWMVDVEVTLDEDGDHYVTGILVRAALPTTPSGTPDDPWLEDGGFDPVVPGEVQHLPLARYARAALAVVKEPLMGEGRRDAKEILLPAGTPSDQPRGLEWYAELLEMAEELEIQGIAAVPEIAKRKNVDENTVHQWLYRARHRGT